MDGVENRLNLSCETFALIKSTIFIQFVSIFYQTLAQKVRSVNFLTRSKSIRANSSIYKTDVTRTSCVVFRIKLLADNT